MDRNFHTDDFERLLREKSDEFRMYPSKRVWYSIYNNIHPGRKWPSVAMSITLIISLLLIGYLNTKNPNLYTGSGKNTVTQKIAAQVKSAPLVSPGLINNPVIAVEATTAIVSDGKIPLSNNGSKSDIANKEQVPGTNSSVLTLLDIIRQQPPVSGNVNSRTNQANTDNAKEETIKPAISQADNLSPDSKIGQIETAADLQIAFGYDVYPGILTAGQKIVISDFTESTTNTVINGATGKKPAITIGGRNSAVEKNNLAVAVIKKDLISAEDKEWIENYALYNRPATKKWANKLSWQLYATPSVVYRKLYNDPNFGNNNAPPFAISNSGQDLNRAVNQKPSIGFEIGTGFQYSISKILKLKAGLQLNYTRYNSEAFQNTHPVATKLTMHDYETNMTYEEIRTTPYSNKSGLEAVKLHNETFQLSLPMGADLKLIGGENLQWNFGVTIQPTYVPGGKSYLISSDRRNYVKETSMIKRWNLNAGFETFISYKAGNGLNFQVGPQFRTQLFSTNSKQIAVEEKLLNYGLKFGISKTLK